MDNSYEIIKKRMQSYKVVRRDSTCYYTRTDDPWGLSDKPEVAKVEKCDYTAYRNYALHGAKNV